MKSIFWSGLLLSALVAPAAWGKISCPAPKACDRFYANQASCAKNPKNCTPFINTFRTLLEKYDCKRKQDTDPVPAVWLCSNHESAVKLLKTLKGKTARDFYKSSKFQGTLDGELAEDEPVEEESTPASPVAE